MAQQREIRGVTTSRISGDAAVRLAAFAFLRSQQELHGDVLPRDTLAAGFQFEGRRVPLVGPQGIFKPAILESIPLSITTAPEIAGKARPYDDEISREGYISYRYRGTDRNHVDNVGLRRAMEQQVPLIHFEGLEKGLYFARYPVYIVSDDPASLTFHVLADEFREAPSDVILGEPSDVRRKYVTRQTMQRLHQAKFRVQVLRAYRYSCTVCTLRHGELLDAAHILPDKDPRSLPVVSNGLGICKLHHAALDTNIIGIRPDLVVDVRRDVLDEIDGPMLEHGLQEMSGRKIGVPRRPDQRPNPDHLEERYEQFKKAG
jgi:putative restriction endonuclease